MIVSHSAPLSTYKERNYTPNRYSIFRMSMLTSVRFLSSSIQYIGRSVLCDSDLANASIQWMSYHFAIQGLHRYSVDPRGEYVVSLLWDVACSCSNKAASR